ncbi:hypothetical protein Q7P37_002906 [Cladosporium fusiforme]
MVVLFATACVVALTLWGQISSVPGWKIISQPSRNELTSEDVSEATDEDVTLVIASQTQDNTTWLAHAFPTWEKAIFLTDAPSRLSVPANKGRESMVYLTYIIDNYDYLPAVVIFHHANRYQWHNDDPLYDGERLLSRLQISHIKNEGYINLRCVWTLGCPSEIRPNKEAASISAEGEEKTGAHYKQAFQELFPGRPVPDAVGASCCAQFAVTREKIQERPRSDYQGYRRWLLETDLADEISGRILEYTWHMIFGKEAVSCPNAGDCYCKTYGICNLDCESNGVWYVEANIFCQDSQLFPRDGRIVTGMEIGWM